MNGGTKQSGFGVIKKTFMEETGEVELRGNDDKTKYIHFLKKSEYQQKQTINKSPQV